MHAHKRRTRLHAHQFQRNSSQQWPQRLWYILIAVLVGAALGGLIDLLGSVLRGLLQPHSHGEFVWLFVWIFALLAVPLGGLISVRALKENPQNPVENDAPRIDGTAFWLRVLGTTAAISALLWVVMLVLS